MSNYPKTARLMQRGIFNLGPTFIKLGQIASTRIDLIGPDVAAELERRELRFQRQLLCDEQSRN